jgi:hypothetical protein
MREVTITAYCDRCVADGAHEPATETFTVAIAPGERPTGRPHLIELCERHGKELHELNALVQEHGLLTDKIATPASRPMATATGTPDVCPVPGCGRRFTTRTGVRDHLRNVHKTSYKAVYGNGGRSQTPATCTVCGFVAASGTGLSAHVRSTHPQPEPEPEPVYVPDPVPLTVRQAAAVAGVTFKSIESGVRRGRLPSTRSDDGHIQIMPADLAEWAAKRPPIQEVMPDAH